MSIYMQSTIELATGALPRFCATMAQLKPIVEGHGWKLVGAWVQTTGRLHTVVDVWQIDDFNHYDRVMQALVADPAFPGISAGLTDSVVRETVVLGHPAPYFAPAA